MRKRGILAAVSAVVLCVACLVLLPVKVQAKPGVWDGKTTKQPTKLTAVDEVYYYEISTAEELAFLAKAQGEWLNYNYILVDDIVLNDVELTYDANGKLTADTKGLNKWTPIDKLDGFFNGNGHTISGVYMDSSEPVAFFKSLKTDVMNVHFKNCYIRSTGGGAGGISIRNLAQDIVDCSFDGAVVGKDYVGGIVSVMDGYVIRCTNDADVFGSGDYVGGIAGYLDCWGIENSVNNGSVKSAGNYVGGIVGACSDLYTPEECLNTGDITGKDYVGGICGAGPNSGWASGDNSGDILGEKYVGGVIGHTDSPTMRGSFKGNNSGDVTGVEYVGGLAGFMQNITVKDSQNTGNVTGTTLVGGLIGHSESVWGRGAVENCYYLKTSEINSGLHAFGNAIEEAEGASGEDRAFFCISDDSTVNAAGHTYSESAACDSTCDNCGYERTVTHTYDIEKFDGENHWYECQCGERSSESEHEWSDAACGETMTCTVCGAVSEEVAEHDFGQWKRTQISLTEKSRVEERVCAECGKTEQREMEKPDKKHSDSSDDEEYEDSDTTTMIIVFAVAAAVIVGGCVAAGVSLLRKKKEN